MIGSHIGQAIGLGPIIQAESSVLLTVDDLSQLQTIGEPFLAPSLVVSDVDQLHALDNVSLIQQNTIAVQELDNIQALDNVTLTAAGTLTVAEVDHLQSLESFSLTQQNVLSVAEMAQAQTLGALDLSVLLLVDSLAHVQALDLLSLVQANVLSVSGLSQQQAIDLIVWEGTTIGELAGTIVLYAEVDGDMALLGEVTANLITVH